MTIEEWTDEVARMTPRQREAMGYAMLASEEACAAGLTKATASCLEYALSLGEGIGGEQLQALYPG